MRAQLRDSLKPFEHDGSMVPRGLRRSLNLVPIMPKTDVNFSHFSFVEHWENYISIYFHIEWNMIVVTVFLSILSQMDFHLVQKLSPRSCLIHCGSKWKYSFLSVLLSSLHWKRISDQTYSCPRNCNVSRHPRSPIEDTLWNSSDHHSSITLRGLRGLLIRTPLCRETPISLSEVFAAVTERLNCVNITYYFRANIGGRCHNLKNGKEASEDTEKSPAGCTRKK